MVLLAQHTRPRQLPVRHWLSAVHADPALKRHCPVESSVFPGEQVWQVPFDEHTSHPNEEDELLQHLVLHVCEEQSEDSEAVQADPGARKHCWLDKKYGELHARHWPLVPHELHPVFPLTSEEQQAAAQAGTRGTVAVGAAALACHSLAGIERASGNLVRDGIVRPVCGRRTE